MNEMLMTLGRWQLNVKAVRERMYGAPTPRERERWHAVWLLAQGWSGAQVAEALERDAHTIGAWAAEFHEKGPAVWPSRRAAAPPRPRPGATNGTEGCRAGCAGGGGH
jgi:hypothetical protein